MNFCFFAKSAKSGDKSKSENRFSTFLIYLILFYALWTGYVFFIYPWVQSLGDTTLLYALVNITIKLLLWVLPVFLYLGFIDHVNPLAYLKLNENWKRGLLFRAGPIHAHFPGQPAALRGATS